MKVVFTSLFVALILFVLLPFDSVTENMLESKGKQGIVEMEEVGEVLLRENIDVNVLISDGVLKEAFGNVLVEECILVL